MPGVIKTRVGYAGGTGADPTYRRIKDHTETVEIDFDPALISYKTLVNIFWTAHDPTSRSFSNQYRSAVFFHNDEQKRIAEETKIEIQNRLGSKIHTAIEPAGQFYLAEDYHQKYYLQNAPVLSLEIKKYYRTGAQMAESTLAARLNGYLGGHGSARQLSEEVESFGLSDRGIKRLWALFPNTRKPICNVPESPG